MFGLSKPQPKAKGAALAQAQNQAPDSIPGMFKPGEFVLPPDTVHAMGGKQALQGVVDATHSQVPVQVDGQAQGLGLKPEVFFANGGAPEDQLKAPISPSNIYPQGSPSAGAGMNRGPGMQFGSSGQFAQVPSGIGGNPAAPARPVAQAPGPSPVMAAAPATAPPAASAPVAAQARTTPGIFPGNRLQGDSGFSGAPVARTVAATAAQDPGAQLKAIADKNSRGERYGSDAPNMANLGLQSPKPAQASAPAAVPATDTAPAATRTPGASELYMQDRTQEMSDQWKAGNYAQAAGTAGRTAVQGLGMYGLELADKALTPAGNAIGGFAKGLLGMSDAQAAGVPATTPAASTAATPTARAGYTHASQGVMGPPKLSTLASPGVNAGTATTNATQSTAGAEVSPGVYNHGRGQYSDQAGGMGLPSGFTGRPNAQNERAAANLASSQPGPQAAPAGGQPDMGGFGLNAPSVAHSGNDWAARQRLKDMETSASSITNRPEWRSGSSSSAWGSRHNQGVNDPDGKIGRFNAATQADLAAQGKQTDATLQTMGLNAGLMRESMGQQGANQRAALAESGATSRANGQLGLGLGRLALDQSRAGSEDRLREPQIRAAERMGQMQEAYINAETPEQKAAIAAEMRAYSGKVEQDRWKSVALQGGTDAAGNKTESLLGAVNERTGEMKRMGAQQQAPQYVKGGVYQDPQGRKQRWNGTAFEPI